MPDDLVAAVAEVGAALLDWRACGCTTGTWDGGQFKAEADGRAHKLLTRCLRRLSQRLPIVSEEDASSQAGPRPAEYWLVDPLDGTASYAGGFDGFVCQVALMDESGPRESVIVAPALGLTYTARRGEGARRNGQRLQIATTGFGVLVDNYPEPRGTAAALYVQMGFRRYLESGSIGLKICRVADGSADVFFKDVLVRDWDLGAPHLVLLEAGGGMADVAGRPFTYRGSYTREGLVAASSQESLRKVVAWYSGRRQEEVGDSRKEIVP